MNLDVAAEQRRHSHVFTSGDPLAERSTRRALVLTCVMMVVEIVGGWWFNSMAVLADGWHMSSHAVALGLSAFAYACARRYARDGRFAFGTWKIEVLGGYTSAIVLLGVAALMAVQSIERLFEPQPIQYRNAMLVAAVGLMVNLLCAWWLRDQHDHGHDDAHGHGHGHSHGHDHGHDVVHTHGRADVRHAPADDHVHGPDAEALPATPDRASAQGQPVSAHADLNLRAAYLHVVADAATSVLALIALAGGALAGASWLDPLMGIVGALLVAYWARGLLRDAGRVLLDAEMDAPVVAEVREAIEHGAIPARISDLHVWRVGRRQYACVASVVTDAPVDARVFHDALRVHEELVHVTVEVQRISV